MAHDMKSALSQHQVKTGHLVSPGGPLSPVVIDRDIRRPYRKVKEAIHIKLENATLNRNDGHELPAMYLPLLRKGAGHIS